VHKSENISQLTFDNVEILGVDDGGNLHWRNDRVVVEQHIKLNWKHTLGSIIVILAAVAQAVAAWWPIVFKG
jgi:hypothetical protein